MRTRTFLRRAAALAAGALAAGALVALLPMPSADAVGAPLTPGEVTDLVSRCVAYADRAPGKPRLAIAVVDVEGNSLGVFRMNGLVADPSARDRAVATALAKAGTGSFFSSDEQTFSTRTAAFIIQDHFPPGVRFQPGGPLYGVEFSSIATTDVNRIYYPAFPVFTIPPTPGSRYAAYAADDPPPEVETRVRGDLGGVGLYKNGRRVGGLGIDDGDERRRVSLPPRVFPGDECADDYRLTFRNIERGRVLESIVLAAARGRLAPPDIRSDKILVGGIRLDYSRGTSLRPISAPTVVPGVDGDWDPDFPQRDAATLASRFADATLDPPSGAGDGARSFDGQVPLAFPIVAAADGSLSADEVSRILWQGARQAFDTRAAIRRPIGVAMQCWISVVDRWGNVLGVFRFGSDATLFSYDVSVQKARTAVFFSDADAAFSSRGVGLFAQGFYPAGQQGAGRGPIFQVQDGVTVGLLGGAFSAANPDAMKIRNGITIFPGGVPLYRDGELIGGVGVSGDGVDQDDIVADKASHGYAAPQSIRCDKLRGQQLKAALLRAVRRIADASPADPHACDTVPHKVVTFLRARLDDALVTLDRTDLLVGPSYVKHPRHPGPVTIRR
jgi:uncharacterized protein GlcG (DUF336 family)